MTLREDGFGQSRRAGERGRTSRQRAGLTDQAGPAVTGHRFGEVTAQGLEELGPPNPVGVKVGRDGLEARDVVNKPSAHLTLADQQRQWVAVTRALNDVWPGSGALLCWGRRRSDEPPHVRQFSPYRDGRMRRL